MQAVMWLSRCTVHSDIGIYIISLLKFFHPTKTVLLTVEEFTAPLKSF